MSKIVKAASPRKIPAEIVRLLGEPTLWRGESLEQYNAMLLEIAISVDARDIVDWLSVKDVTHHVFDYCRLHAIKAATILARADRRHRGASEINLRSGRTARRYDLLYLGSQKTTRAVGQPTLNLPRRSMIDLPPVVMTALRYSPRPTRCAQMNCRCWIRLLPTGKSAGWPPCADSSPRRIFGASTSKNIAADYRW